ncbi:MAG: bifunctional methylenetetrahydrofolate dehydrogenase/methenyltetrahydrofolate cyclohydrolase FolD [Bacteroidota bacterium]
MKIIDGKKIAEDIRTEIAIEVRAMLDADHKAPHLVAILVGEDEASQAYVSNKEKDCREVGFISTVYKMAATTSEAELLKTIDFINHDDEVDGLIVQLPLPSHISANKVIEHIRPEKDVDGFHPQNTGRMMSGMPAFLPATPFGIIELLKRSSIETQGKHCVILGRSNIVGTPMSILLSRNANPGNCTVTVCHSKTPDIQKYTLQADIIIAAVGKPHFLKADMIKQGAVVIDVGIHRVPSIDTKSGFKLTGDVDFGDVARRCSYITPVPGGVGPMTRVALLMNTLKSAKKEIYR